MFSEQLKKILQLVNRTGDRVIVVDQNHPNESFVIMGFDNYASLVDSGREVLQADTETVARSLPDEQSDPVDITAKNKDYLTEEDLTDKINREISVWKNKENSPYLAEESKSRPGWKIPSQVKDKALEVKE